VVKVGANHVKRGSCLKKRRRHLGKEAQVKISKSRTLTGAKRLEELDQKYLVWMKKLLSEKSYLQPEKT
jgi:hypothetical protein